MAPYSSGGPQCDFFCKGPHVEVTCTEYTDNDLLECHLACLDCYKPRHQCHCPKVLVDGGFLDGIGGGGGEEGGEEGGGDGDLLGPGGGDGEGGDLLGPGGGGGEGGGLLGPGGGNEESTTRHVTGVNSGEYIRETDILAPVQDHRDNDLLIYVLVAFIILILLILLCLCWYWWALKSRRKESEQDQAAYAAITPVGTMRSTDKSPYVGYDYPKRRRHHRRRRRQEVQAEESVKDEPEERAPIIPPPKEGCAEDEEEVEVCEDEEEDESCDQPCPMKIYYEMCL